MKDPGSGRPGYELDDLVDDMEDTYSKLSELDHCISLEELEVSLIQIFELDCDESESMLQQEDIHCAVNIPAEKNSKWYRAVISALDGPAVQVVLIVF